MASKRTKRARERSRRHSPSIHDGGVAPPPEPLPAPRAPGPESAGIGGMVREFRRRARQELDANSPEPTARPKDGRVRPEPLWGSFPLSELAIAVGLVIGIIGFSAGGGPAFLAGIGICIVAVGEVALREHLTGYRAHSMLVGLLVVAIFQALMYAVTGGNWVGLRAGVSGVIVFIAVSVLMRRWFKRIEGRPVPHR